MLMRAIHIVALVPFVIAALLIIQELLGVAQYYQKLANCELGACPDVVPSYGNTATGITVASVGIALLLVDWIKRRHSAPSLAMK